MKKKLLASMLALSMAAGMLSIVAMAAPDIDDPPQEVAVLTEENEVILDSENLSETYTKVVVTNVVNGQLYILHTQAPGTNDMVIASGRPTTGNLLFYVLPGSRVRLLRVDGDEIRFHEGLEQNTYSVTIDGEDEYGYIKVENFTGNVEA